MSKRKGTKLSILGLLIIFLFLIPLFDKSAYHQIHILIMMGISLIMATSFRSIANTGQLSFGHGGMMTLGAYTSTLLVMKLGLSFWPALIVAGLAAGVLAAIVGFPFTRIKGVYFGITTLFLTQIIILFAEQWKSMTNGSAGIIHIPPPNRIVVPGLLTIDFSSKVDFYYLILILVLITLLILYALENSRIGLTFHSLRQSDSLAESLGINTTKYKIIAFSIGSVFAGIAGAFYAAYITAIAPSTFGFIYTVYVVAYVMVGGLKSFLGPILGAIVLTILPELFRAVPQYQPFLFAASLLFVIFYLPKGLVGVPAQLKNLLRKRISHA
jgi:branched-chain amino acid transport system permease protein